MYGYGNFLKINRKVIKFSLRVREVKIPSLVNEKNYVRLFMIFS